jgi:hypothetical protein
LKNEFILEDNMLEGKVLVLMVPKCLILTIEILPLELANDSMFLNLITPSLNILIYGLWLLNNLHVYLQTLFFNYPSKQINNPHLLTTVLKSMARW